MIRQLLETVFDQQAQVVPLVEHLALDLGVELTQQPNLSVLLCHELLTHRGDFDIEIITGEVEVGPEEADRLAALVKANRKLARLVFPLDFVEI